MSLPFARRAALGFALALGATVQPAWAQGFPGKPIHLVVTGAPGASTDFIARRLAKVIHAQSGANLVVENQGGASGSIALTTGKRPLARSLPRCDSRKVGKLASEMKLTWAPPSPRPGSVRGLAII